MASGAAGIYDPAVETHAAAGQAEHNRATREVYDRLAPVWAATTDDGPWNGHLERPAVRELVPGDLAGKVILEAACGSGAQSEWLLGQGADVIGFDLSPGMIAEAGRRCGDRGRFLVADLAEPLPLAPASVDGITCSLAMHYLRDWSVPLRSFATALKPGGWAVISSDHPFAAPLPSQRGGYFDTELVSDTWRKADVEVTPHFWRRPLGAVFSAFSAAGFAVDRIGEPRPSPEALRRYPEELSSVAGAPWFIVYRLRLQVLPGDRGDRGGEGAGRVHGPDQGVGGERPQRQFPGPGRVGAQGGRGDITLTAPYHRHQAEFVHRRRRHRERGRALLIHLARHLQHHVRRQGRDRGAVAHVQDQPGLRAFGQG